MKLYNSLVDSYLRYGIVSWGTCAHTLKLPLQRIQNRVIHTLNTSNANNQNPQGSKILNLSNLYLHETGKFMHSLAYRYSSPAFDGMFSVISHDQNTRFRTNTQFKLINPRTNTGKKSLRYVGVKCWANISPSLKLTEKLESFSKLFKRELLSQQRQQSPGPPPVGR